MWSGRACGVIDGQMNDIMKETFAMPPRRHVCDVFVP